MRNDGLTVEKQNARPAPAAVLSTGNHACAEGALAAGCRFFGGYPITPSSEIAELMSKRLPLVDGTFIQMEDEIASMGAIIGASVQLTAPPPPSARSFRSAAPRSRSCASTL